MLHNKKGSEKVTPGVENSVCWEQYKSGPRLMEGVV